MLPATQGSTTSNSGLITRISGMTTAANAFAAMLLPRSWLSTVGRAQSSLWTREGNSPCALHASARVARRTLLPTQGGDLRALKRHGKCVLAFLVLCRVRETCSSIAQSSPLSNNVSRRRATFWTHSAAAFGSIPSTLPHLAGSTGFPSPSMSFSLRVPSLRDVVTRGASVARSARTPQM